jgi:hypothetical protein
LIERCPLDRKAKGVNAGAEFDRFDSNLKILAPVERAIDGRGPHEFPDREEIEAAVLELLE